MPKQQLFDVTVQKVQPFETDLAWRLSDGTKTEWFPKSQRELSEPDSKGLQELTAPEWLLRAKGFI